MTQRLRFLIWFAICCLVVVVANWPRASLGSLIPFLVWAGLPWNFAHWEHGRLMWFDPVALVADVALGIAVSVLAAGLCAWSAGAKRRTTVASGSPTAH